MSPEPRSPGSVRASWWTLASSPPVVKRASVMAGVVGVILIAINHGPALLGGDVSVGRVLQMGLTVLVPYTVSTVSSVLAMRDGAGGRGR